MKYRLIYTTKFKKDYKLSIKRGMPIELLKDTITLLQNGQPLPSKMHDHALVGDFIGFRECHILPDWLLLYFVEGDTITLTLARTGSHSDIFK